MPNRENTKQWERHCRSELSADHEDEVFAKLVPLARSLGFDYVGVSLELPKSVAEPWVSLHHNFRPDWRKLFTDRGHRSHGARYAVGRRSERECLASDPKNWTRMDLYREAHVNGVSLDMVDKVVCPEGTWVSVGFGGNCSPVSDCRRASMRVLVRVSASVLRRVMIPKNMPQARVHIDDVERRYMSWVLDGKKAGEIATILGITQSASENLQRKLPDKFQVKGIIVASVLALRMGLLGPC